MKVRAKWRFRPWGYGSEDPGPVVEPGQEMTVIDTVMRKICGTRTKYLVVLLDGKRYEALPWHLERA